MFAVSPISNADIQVWVSKSFSDFVHYCRYLPLISANNFSVLSLLLFSFFFLIIISTDQVGTLGIYGALYFLFVYMFGSADGTVSLKKKDRAGKAAAAPAAKATRSRSSSRKR